MIKYKIKHFLFYFSNFGASIEIHNTRYSKCFIECTNVLVFVCVWRRFGVIIKSVVL